MAGLDADTSSYGGYAATNKLLATPTNTADSLNGWLTAARQGQALNAAQFDLAQKHLTALNTLAASVMADPSPDNATARISQGVQMGVIPADEGAKELQSLGALGGDPAKIKQWAFDHAQTIASVQQQMDSAYGTTGLVSNGQQLIPVTTRTGPQGGVYAAGGNPLQQYMTPGEASAPQTMRLANGTEVQTTTRGYGQGVGDTAGLPPGQGAPGPAAAPAPGYSGVSNPNSYVDPHRAASAGVSIVNGRPVYGGTGTPAPPGTQPGDVISPGPVGGRAGTSSRGPTIAGGAVAQPQPQPMPQPQAGAAQPAVPGLAGPSPMLGSGLKAYQEDQANASAKMDGVRSLTQALPLIQQLGATGSGPGTAAFQKAKSTLVSLGVLSPDTPDVSAYDEAKKYLNQYVAKSALAGRSDMGQLQAQASSPNLETSNAATAALAQNAIAADRMDAARPFAWSGDNLAGYGQFKAGYTQGQDLRAYKLDLMPPADRNALLNDMKAKQNTPEGRRFWQSLQNAHNAGVLTGLPTGGAGGQQ